MSVFSQSRNIQRLRWLAVGLAVAGVALQIGAPHRPQLVEILYGQMVYPVLARGLRFTSTWLPFSLAELIVGLVIILALAGTGWLLRTMWTQRADWKALVKTGVVNVLVAGGILLLGFQLCWGLNYSRLPVSQRLALPSHQATPAEVKNLCQFLIAEANRAYAQAQTQTGPKPPGTLALSLDEVRADLEASFRRATWIGPTSQGSYSPAKPVFFSPVLSYAGISGVYFPFTSEPNFNADMPGCDLPFTLAHEMAHQRGFAPEDEANFVAFLICITAEQPYCQYSGYLLGARYLMGDACETRECTKELLAQFATGPQADLKAVGAFWARYRGIWQDLSQRVNHTYLRANNVTAGVGSYNLVVRLITDYYHADHLADRSSPQNSISHQ
ncbi:MAG TPA: DUF3810 domain-containing protein [Acidobacteriota bacterium]|nr:DUF3810 domain-containing protein [Acidobacteriota bacterium]